MQDQILNYLTSSGPDSRSRMVDTYREETVEFSRLLALMIDPLTNFMKANPTNDPARPFHAAYGLLTKGANTLGAAYELILSGYLWEPPALFRIVVESCAVAWDITTNPDRYQLWLAGKKFQSTDSIGSAKSVIADIGRLYGLLSQMNVHTSVLNASPAMFLSDGTPKFQLLGLVPSGKEVARKSDVYHALFITYICLQLTEAVFWKHSSRLETLEPIAGTEFAQSTVSATHRQFADQAIRAFQDLVNDTTIAF